MKKTLLTLCFLSAMAFAQNGTVTFQLMAWEDLANKSINIEGEGFIEAGTYMYLAPGGGFGVEMDSDLWDLDAFMFHIPHHFTANFGFSQSKNFLEVGYKGVETVLTWMGITDGVYSSYIYAGYRFMSDGAFAFKAYAAPGWIFGDYGTEFTILWGVGLGFKF